MSMPRCSADLRSYANTMQNITAHTLNEHSRCRIPLIVGGFVNCANVIVRGTIFDAHYRRRCALTLAEILFD